MCRKVYRVESKILTYRDAIYIIAEDVGQAADRATGFLREFYDEEPEQLSYRKVIGDIVSVTFYIEIEN